jgi:hypothetical protein
MIDLAAEQIPWLFSGVVLRRADVSAKREVATRFLKAVIEGNYLALTDAKRAKEVLAKELKLTDQKIIDISHEDFKAQSPPNMEPSIKGAENVIAQTAGSGSRNIADYIDSGILDDLKKTTFFATLQQKYGLR